MIIGVSSNRLSFSRDFTALTVLVVFVLALIAGWTVYETYQRHSESVINQLETEATRIDRTLVLEFEKASYLLESMARQILHIGPDNLKEISRLLRSFDEKETVLNIFAWIDREQQVVVTSDSGGLARPIDVSDRDYMKKTIIEPWKVQIGRPIKGRVTGKQVIPLALGVNDYQGNYIGTILVSIDIDLLVKGIKQQLYLSDTSFAIITDSLMVVAESSPVLDFVNVHFPVERLQRLDEEAKDRKTRKAAVSLLWDKNKLLTHSQRSAGYPYVFLLGLNPQTQLGQFYLLLWKRTVPLFGVAVLLVFILWIIRHRVVMPLQELASATEKLTQGSNEKITIEGPKEITYLAQQLQKISDYIDERRRIEHEQRNKTALMKRAKEQAELSNRVKLDFMSSMSHELRIPLNTIIGFSELMKNEVYGKIENEQYRQYVEDIYHSADLLQSLINDVLALSKAEAEMLELQEKPLDVQFVITKCVRVLGTRLKDAGITIENRIKKDMPKLRVDELRLKQIVINLLTNSMSHTPSGGSIVVDAEITIDKKDQPQFEIIITDFGAKRLPLQHQASLREQMDEKGKPKLRSRSHIGQLSNLGIPLTKALVAMHQAVLDIQSPPGKATKVIVRFPAERIVE